MSIITRMTSLLEAAAGKTYREHELNMQQAFLSDVAALLPKQLPPNSKITAGVDLNVSTVFLTFKGATRSGVAVNGSVSLVPAKNDSVLVLMNVKRSTLGNISNEAQFKTSVLTAQSIADMVLNQLDQ
jgi:hypothetical protein